MSEPKPVPGDIVVRPLTERDIPAFLDLVQGLAEYEKLPGPGAEARERLTRDALADPPRFWTLLAERNGRVIGYGLYFFTYSTFLARTSLYVEDVFVLPAERRRGAGTAIMRELAKETVRLGCGRMEWSVLDWNEPAIALYESLGGKILDEWRIARLTGHQLTSLAAR